MKLGNGFDLLQQRDATPTNTDGQATETLHGNEIVLMLGT